MSRWWTNFGEDGAWQFWWHNVKSGCWRGHDWKTHEDIESWDVGAWAKLGEWDECRRCGCSSTYRAKELFTTTPEGDSLEATQNG